jgi:heat shock protein HslJ
MKKALFVLPLAVLLVNCSTSRNNTSEMQGNTSADATMTDGSMSSTNVPAIADQAQYGSTVTIDNTSQADVADVLTTSDGYHVNTDLTNGNVYNGYNDARAADLVAAGTGGWTYNTDTRRNTNFNSALNGSWTLRMTPEVATAWRSDQNRPQDYASYWTRDAMGNRQTYLSASATMDTRNSTMGNDNMASIANNGTNTGTDMAGTSGTTSSSSNTSNSVGNASGNTSMSGTTTASGQLNASNNLNNDQHMTGNNNMMNNNAGSIADISYRAANGNDFMLPSLNLYIENGSFTGYTGCNQVMGSLTVDGDRLRFDNTTPATAIECSGGFDQQAFIDRLKRVNSYEMVNNEMRLKDGNEVLLVLAKK